MIVTIKGQKVCLPDFFIVGAVKSATTSLYSYLKQHPKIFLPQKKELYFFAFNGESPRFKLDDGSLREKMGCKQRDYFEMYANTPSDSIMGDTSSWYLYYYEEVINNIKVLYGPQAKKVKIIMILRNPIERAWSHYTMHKNNAIINISFKSAISPGPFRNKLSEGYYPGYDYIGFGMYSRQVEAFLSFFDDVKILLYEDFSKNSGFVVSEILKFLDLETGYVISTSKRLNVSGIPRSFLARWAARIIFSPNILKKMLIPLIPRNFRYKIRMNASGYIYKKNTMGSDDRLLLIDTYKNDISRLQEIIKRDLSGWLL